MRSLLRVSVRALLPAVAAGLLMGFGTAGAKVGAENSPVTYQNPLLYADYSDPDVIRSGDAYYLVASSFHMSPGLPVLRSHDLVHWTLVSHVLARLPDTPAYNLVGAFKITDANPRDTAGTKYGGGPWAPSIREHGGRFFVYWATPDEGIFMATARRPEGPWSAPTTVISGPGFEDPCPFWDEDGTTWLVHSKVGAGPLILHRMRADGTGVLDEGQLIAEDKKRLPVLEGPKLYKRNGWYYIFAPIGGVGTGPQAVGRSRRLEGPYEWRDVLLPGGDLKLKGPHQGGWVETPDGNGWFLHFNLTGAFGRIVHLQPLTWQQDWPIIGAPVSGQDAGLPVARWPMPNTRKSGGSDRLQGSDQFGARRLSIQWQWNHNPDDSAWSLRARPGFLSLTALPASQIVTSRNTLTQVMQGPAPGYVTRLEIGRMANGQRAGLTLFNAQPSWLGVVRDEGANRIVLSRAGQESAIADVSGSVRSVVLAANVTKDGIATYRYSLDDGRSFAVAGEPLKLAWYGWWKGTRPGLFSFNTLAQGGVADFDWFRARQDMHGQ
ncbi:beta-xylosidase [Novosphingobium sp. PhB55]|nr:beta-xylosidase [Novosphingobium sp. PhB55]